MNICRLHYREDCPDCRPPEVTIQSLTTQLADKDREIAAAVSQAILNTECLNRWVEKHTILQTENKAQAERIVDLVDALRNTTEALKKYNYPSDNIGIYRTNKALLTPTKD